MGITTLGRRLTSATLVASVAVLGFTALRASPAHAVVPSQDGVVGGSPAQPMGAANPSSSVTAAGTNRVTTGGVVGGTTGTNAPAGPFTDAPTVNLFRIASHLVLRHKSVSALVSVTPGLGITNAVEISALFSTQRVTQNYSADFGNRLTAELGPVDGRTRQVKVEVTLREYAPTGPITYVVTWVIDVEPLFDLTISPLSFKALGSCDPVGVADPVIMWSDPEGDSHHVVFHANSALITDGFAGTWREVGVSSGLTKPTVGWYENDNPFGASFFPSPSGPPVLPGKSDHIRLVLSADDCDGQFDFDITLTARHYVLI
jgi:hypothetical protein